MITLEYAMLRYYDTDGVLAYAKTTATAPLICPTEHKWNGGTPLPLDTYHGSCYCGNDKYCMCTPSLAIDAIIEVKNHRKNRLSVVTTTPITTATTTAGIPTAVVAPVVTSLPPPIVAAGVPAVPSVPSGPIGAAGLSSSAAVAGKVASSLLTSSSGRLHLPLFYLILGCFCSTRMSCSINTHDIYF